MTKTELLAEILGEAREYESEDGTRLVESKLAITAGLEKDLRTLSKTLSRMRDNDQEMTPVTRRGLVQAAGAIVALLTDDLTADKPDAEMVFP
jgi:hypothetical protein